MQILCIDKLYTQKNRYSFIILLIIFIKNSLITLCIFWIYDIQYNTKCMYSELIPFACPHLFVC